MLRVPNLVKSDLVFNERLTEFSVDIYTRIWLDLILKKNLKKCVDWSQIDKTEYLDAMRESVTDPAKIFALLENALTSEINDREIIMKGIDYSYYYETEE